MSGLSQGRLESDIDKLKREQDESANKQRTLEMSILRGNEQMEQFKLVMNWNQEEFEQWDAASKQKEDDNLALEKYARQDETRIKDMTLTLEKASKEAQARKRELDNEITETQASTYFESASHILEACNLSRFQVSWVGLINRCPWAAGSTNRIGCSCRRFQEAACRAASPARSSRGCNGQSTEER